MADGVVVDAAEASADAGDLLRNRDFNRLGPYKST